MTTDQIDQIAQIVAAVREAVRPPKPAPSFGEVVRAAARRGEIVVPFPEPGQTMPLGAMLRARHRRGK